MRVERGGVTRLVILVGRWAIKLPRFGYGWSAGLRGLLCNMQEAAFSTTGWPELCPVVFSAPGGWFIIMRRARPLSTAEWELLDQGFDAFIRRRYSRDAGRIPVERKADSFGRLDGRIVAVDYGS